MGFMARPSSTWRGPVQDSHGSRARSRKTNAGHKRAVLVDEQGNKNAIVSMGHALKCIRPY